MQSTNMHTQNTLGPTGLYELVLVAVLCTWKTSNVQTKCQGPLQLLSSPPFLMTSTTKQMRPNGKGEAEKGKVMRTSLA